MSPSESELLNGQPSWGRHVAQELIAELRQPLTAAANYVATARAIIGSSDGDRLGEAGEILDKAGDQILAAGKVVSRIHDCLVSERSPDPKRSAT